MLSKLKRLRADFWREKFRGKLEDLAEFSPGHKVYVTGKCWPFMRAVVTPPPGYRHGAGFPAGFRPASPRVIYAALEGFRQGLLHARLRQALLERDFPPVFTQVRAELGKGKQPGLLASRNGIKKLEKLYRAWADSAAWNQEEEPRA